MGVAVDACGRVDQNCKTSVGGAGSWAAAGRRVISIGVLGHSEIGPEILVTIHTSNKTDGNESFSSGGVGVESSKDGISDNVGTCCNSSVMILVDDKSIDRQLNIVFFSSDHSISCCNFSIQSIN